MRIVGLVGRKRAGKSTAADVLVRERGFVSIGFADALKELALRINPVILDDWDQPGPLAYLVEQHGWEGAKGTAEVRRFLQELGTGVRDIVGPESWIDCLHVTMMDAYYDGASGMVIPDIRFENEAEYVRHLNGGDWETMLIRVARPSLDDRDTHVSETEQLGIECDVEIINGGTVDELTTAVLKAVDDAFRS
jgi:deoxynucleotide monophosphate kinase-like protein